MSSLRGGVVSTSEWRATAGFRVTGLDIGMASYEDASMKPLAEATSIPEVAVFNSFEDDELWNVPGYQRNLPHWRLEGASYFVTFRLADSIPSEVARGWKEDRERWLRSHGIEPAWEKQDGERFRAALSKLGEEGELEAFRKQQARQFFVELDKCYGCCVLREAHALVLEALEHFHGSRLWLGDCVVMPNHVHVIAQPFPGSNWRSGCIR